MVELIAGAAIALSWVGLFTCAWLVQQISNANLRTEKALQECHDRTLRTLLRVDNVKRTLDKMHIELGSLTAELDAYKQLSTAETGIYNMKTDPSTGKRTWVKAQDLEDQYFASAERGPDDVLEAAARMMTANART